MGLGDTLSNDVASVSASGRPRARRRAAAARRASGTVEPQLRAELFSFDQLARHATTLAGWHELAPRRDRGRGEWLLERLDDNQRVLRAAYDVLTAAAASGRQLTPAAEWLIDNDHLI